MPKLQYLVLCDAAAVVDMPFGDRRLQINAPTYVLRPRSFPTEFSFTVYIAMIDVDLSTPNVLRLVVQSENEIIHNTGDLMLPPAQEPIGTPLPPQMQGFEFSIDFKNIPFDTEGIYKLVVYFNDTEIEARNIPVYKR